jgi:hypothetical protein
MSRNFSSYPPARELKYLPDVARLEWALERANIAATRALDTVALAGVPRAAWRAAFLLAPIGTMCVVDVPNSSYWQANHPDGDADERIDLDDGGDTLLCCDVRRMSEASRSSWISGPEHLLLSCLAPPHARRSCESLWGPCHPTSISRRRFSACGRQTITGFCARGHHH